MGLCYISTLKMGVWKIGYFQWRNFTTFISLVSYWAHLSYLVYLSAVCYSHSLFFVNNTQRYLPYLFYSPAAVSKLWTTTITKTSAFCSRITYDSVVVHNGAMQKLNNYASPVFFFFQIVVPWVWSCLEVVYVSNLELLK